MRVLLVDDDAMHLLILKRIFENSKDTVVTAKNGREALLVLDSNSDFNVILTDISMPVMDGVELLAKVKANGKTKGIPVIGFTSGDVNYYREISTVPFDSLVPKPLDFSDLRIIAEEKARFQVN
ncbi:MAG: response regulator [Algoriphagus sp.]|uniref:response regulator n=1 Tax=Algoriphagus sp. TaxID=1872435 RepID=UPI00184A5C32|nr:response regulator [Algoriphagus sp.]NVJ84857.1 response regulator [Algoriphagus sp.]